MRTLLLLVAASAVVAMPVLDKHRPVCDKRVIDEVNNDPNSTWVARESDVFKGVSMTEFRNSFLGLKVDREYEYVPVKSHKGLDVELPAEFNAVHASDQRPDALWQLLGFCRV
jgi:hypothetical protein